MTKLEEYNKALAELHASERLFSKIGKKYGGGGGGIGHIVKADLTYSIYYQQYDGATNYHSTYEESNNLRSSLAEACKIHSKEIISTTMKLMKENAEKLRLEALEEYKSLSKSILDTENG